MRFLADNCFPGSAVVWLQERGHDVVRAVDLGPDPAISRSLVSPPNSTACC
jgi:hypothetical protein